MTTRQRRFFVMLVHLLGVSLPTYTTNNNSNSNNDSSNTTHTTTSSNSTHSTKHPYTGRGVSAKTVPLWPMVLERIQLQPPPPPTNHHPTRSDSNKEKRQRRRRRRRTQPTDTNSDTNESTLAASMSMSSSSVSPLWLQNTRDGSCLGPMGTFSECGDATLWWMERYPVAVPRLDMTSSSSVSTRRRRNQQEQQQQQQQRKRRRLLRSSTTPSLWSNNNNNNNNSSSDSSTFVSNYEDDDDDDSSESSLHHGYIFRVVDYDATLSTATTTAAGVSSTLGAAAATTTTAVPGTSECLRVTDASSLFGATRPNNNKEDENTSGSVVHVAPCPRVLNRPRWWWWWMHRMRPIQIRTVMSTPPTTTLAAEQRSMVWRLTPNGQMLHSSFNDTTNEIVWRCVAQQQQSTQSSSTTTTRTSSNQAVLVDCDGNGDNNDDNNDANHVPVQFALFRYRPVAASTLKSAAALGERKGLVPQQQQRSNARSLTPNKQTTAVPSSLADPLLHPELKIASKLIFDRQQHIKPSTTTKESATSVAAGPKSSLLQRLLMNANPSLVALQSSRQSKKDRLSGDDFPAVDDSALKLRRMQSHPYLAEAKDGVWTDPQTGLAFHTDLCRYLGRNCNEQGRHTLTGMGIYRKGYVIKVYGIAYYVSKRDVLVNPSMERYATLTAEQLRARPDFYEMLRKVGHFDRTIMLKTNMQLSAETMRSSLQADWSYLTEEAKSTLVGVSMNARPADEAMLQLIQSPDNPSRCSCGQTAQLEFNANPDCCARGTELVFTWTKTNDLEVRLNGRLMEAFPRPDIAEGIFYEYLRYDDPISPELLDRVVDGFPFLLGPIAGINDQAMTSPSENAVYHFQAMLEAMTAMKDTLMLQAMDFGDSVKRSASDTADHAGNAVKAFGLAAKEFAVEADRRRDLLVKHTVAAPTVLMKLLEHDEETILSFTRWMSGETNEQDIPQEENEALLSSDRRLPRGRIFGYSLARLYGEEYFAPDEIGPMRIHPTINKFFLTLVHLYLLLLFIVSFPGSHSTRTRRISRKSAYSGQDLSDDSDSDISEDNDKLSLDESMEIDPHNTRALYGARGFLFSGNRNPRQHEMEISKIVPPIESGFRKKSLSYFL